MPVEQSGDQRGARHSTRFYGVADDLHFDLSQFGTDLSTGASGVVYEDDTPRMGQTGPRTLRWRLELNESDGGFLWWHGDGADFLEVVGPGVAGAEATINVTIGGASVSRDVGAWPTTATDERIRLAWVTTANPGATGAADAMLSWLLVHNEDTGAVARVSFSHPVKSASVSQAAIGARDDAGQSPFTGAILAFGYDVEPTTLTQIEHDWGTVQADVPSAEGLTTRPVVPLPAESTAGAAGEFFGVAPQWAALSHHRARRRHFSPLVNERFPVPESIRDAITEAGGPWSPVPDGSGYRYSVTMLRKRLVPAAAGVAWVRAHMAATVTENANVDIGLRCYSFDAHPSSPDLSDVRFVQEVVTTGAAPRHLLEQLLTLAQRGGVTWLALALNFDPEGVAATTAFARAVISDWHALPRALDSGSGELPIGGLDGG